MDASGKPGYIASSAAHVVLLCAMLVSFSGNPKFQDVQETVPVDLVTDSSVNQIVKGDKSAKAVQPHPRVDKLAETEEAKPKPPIADAKRDVPTPPPPLKRSDNPGEAEKDQPPKPPAQAAPPPEPTPKPPPLPPVEDKPPPDMAADEPLPPPRPKIEKPKPPKRVVNKPPKFKLDQIAKLLDEDKPKNAKSHERAAARPKSGDNSHEDRKFSADDISRLLSKEAPQRRASTGRRLQQLASLGSPTANAPRLSPSLEAAMEGWFQDRFQDCWIQPITLPQGPKYVPEIRVPLNLDGSLAAEPELLNPPSDPAWEPLAESAMRAVRKCDPLPVPDRFKPYYDAWRNRIVRFDDQDM